MASANEKPSFNEIIQAGREQKKRENLAAEIFGKGKRPTTPLGTKSGKGGSLASRVTKPGTVRSASSSSVQRARAAHSGGRGIGSNLQASKSQTFAHLLESAARTGTAGFSIKGRAGPYIVVGSNFAPGTTSADVQSAIESVTGNMLSCSIVVARPTVIAEMAFEEKAQADTVVATFNNQKADGRILHLYHKHGPPATPAAAAPPALPRQSRDNRAQDYREPRNELASSRPGGPRDGRLAQPDFQDGRYGFDAGADDAMVDVDAAEGYDGRRNDGRPFERDDRRNHRRGGRNDEHDNYRGGSAAHGNNVQNNGRNSGPPRGPRNERNENRSLYSDNMYNQNRNRGNGPR